MLFFQKAVNTFNEPRTIPPPEDMENYDCLMSFKDLNSIVLDTRLAGPRYRKTKRYFFEKVKIPQIDRYSNRIGSITS